MPGAPRGQQTGLIDAVIIKHLALIGHSPYPYDKDFRDVRLLSKDVDTLDYWLLVLLLTSRTGITNLPFTMAATLKLIHGIEHTTVTVSYMVNRQTGFFTILCSQCMD